MAYVRHSHSDQDDNENSCYMYLKQKAMTDKIREAKIELQLQ